VKFHAEYHVVGNDAPSTVYFIRENFPEVHFWHPKEKFIPIVRKKGLPTMQRRFCCERTKEAGGKGEVVLTGVRAEESRKRAGYSEIEIFSRRKEHEGKDRSRDVEWLKEVEHQCLKGQDRVLVRPLLNWTEDDIWEYTQKYKWPVNPNYATCGRVGCMFCPFAPKEQIEHYEQTYPGFARAIMDALYIYWDKYNTHLFPSPEVYYRWWKSKKSAAIFSKLELAVPLNENKGSHGSKGATMVEQ
jgi:phosphoadenosine phosphosulfate reductase